MAQARSGLPIRPSDRRPLRFRRCRQEGKTWAVSPFLPRTVLGGHLDLVQHSHAVGHDSAPAAPADVATSLAPGTRLAMLLVDALDFLVAPLRSSGSHPFRHGLRVGQDASCQAWHWRDFIIMRPASFACCLPLALTALEWRDALLVVWSSFLQADTAFRAAVLDARDRSWARHVKHRPARRSWHHWQPHSDTWCWCSMPSRGVRLRSGVWLCDCDCRPR
jgi:hypothetical protein